MLSSIILGFGRQILAIPATNYAVIPAGVRLAILAGVHPAILAGVAIPIRYYRDKISDVMKKARHTGIFDPCDPIILKARTLLAEVASPLVKPGQRGKHATDKDSGDMAVEEEIFMASELMVNRGTPNGYRSFVAAISIEQFGRSVQDERFDRAEDAEDIQSACSHRPLGITVGAC
ncbi:hypothetical protein ZIOFF_014826 [Zingiber officinale]|uniref:Uncharacterized protein n=1 Tax=Zingiber officinale TaxID=94328 RepID=A0A8J5LLY6_ZINOF|nr:hypothetical protein ZIOFF_014826 [Zingiber officinale]